NCFPTVSFKNRTSVPSPLSPLIGPRGRIHSRAVRTDEDFVKRIHRIFVFTALSLGPVFCDNNPPDPNAASTSESKLPEWLQLGGQIRGRFEDPSGTSAANNVSNAYYLSRIRIDLGIKPVSWLRFFAQAQDQRVADYATSPAPNTIYNPIDLRQAFAEINTEGTVGVKVRAGRQELIFGAERLIGASDWGISRTFDAVDLTLSKGRAKVDLFGGSVVLIDPTRFD